jgi:methanogenic corrinoid protein MtbC1
MNKTNVLERYLSGLLEGDRAVCRTIIEETLQTGMTANSVYMDVIWPIMVEVDNLYRQDRISSAQEAFATRINRTIVDQLQNKLPRKPIANKKVVVYSAATEQGELGGQMIADLFESNGWDVRFVGASVNFDDLLSFSNKFQADIMLVYGMSAKQAPAIRQLIDKIKTINASPDMRVMLSGGVFDRAEGLWEEIGADMYAENAAKAVELASADPENIPQPEQTINRRKRTKKNVEVQEAVKASA